jgi:hypothetical protein
MENSLFQRIAFKSRKKVTLTPQYINTISTSDINSNINTQVSCVKCRLCVIAVLIGLFGSLMALCFSFDGDLDRPVPMC